MTSSTERVAKHRAKLRATKRGSELINETRRSENKKHHLKVKKLKSEIASYEKTLGIESKNKKTTARARAPVSLPPKEELQRMSMAELTEWKLQQRIIRRRQASREKKKEDNIKSLETRLSTLQDMSFLTAIEVAEDLPCNSAVPEPSCSELPCNSAIPGPSCSESNFTEELDFNWIQGILDNKVADLIRSNQFVPLSPKSNVAEELDPAGTQEIDVGEDEDMAWLDFSHDLASDWLQEVADMNYDLD